MKESKIEAELKMANDRKKHIGAIALCMMIAALAAAGCGGRGGGGAAADTTVSTGSVAGSVYARVVSAGRVAEAAAPGLMPLPDVTVTCAGVSVSSNTYGRYVASGVPVGQQTCVISKQGYGDVSFSVFVRPNSETVYDDVVQEPEQTGALDVTSTPAGAAVIIDDAAVAATAPATLDSLAAGSHTVSVSLEGYENGATQSVDIATGATASLAFTLHKLVTSITVSPVSVSVNIGATQQLTATCVFYDGTSADCTSEVDWQATGAAASVSAGGLVTTLAEGTASVTATRTQSGVSSAAVAVTVGAVFAELDCSAATGLCIDIVGTDADAAGAALVRVSLLNPPAAGLGAGEFSVSWDPTAMTLTGVSPAAGVSVLASSVSNTAGTYKVIFLASAAITAGQDLFSMSYSLLPAAAGQTHLVWGSSAAETNMTDFTAALLASTSYSLMDGYINKAQ